MSKKALLPTTLNNLPQEIMMDILWRLPVKSLLRFRCVSKPWRSLISDAQFVKLHLSRSISSDQQRVLLSTIPLQSIDCDAEIAITELDWPLRTRNHFVAIMGSCNGLVCLLVDEEHIVVYNPSTRQFKELPQPPGIESSFRNSELLLYGFGYDSIVDDYKVVGAEYTQSGEKRETKCEVFNLKRNSWRSTTQELDKSLVFSLEERMGIFFNRALHWHALRRTQFGFLDVIVYFDLSNEVFGEMPPPYFDRGVTKHYTPGVLGGCHYNLGVLGGCLCVLLYHGPRAMVELWMMKEYGVKASWTKLINYIPLDMSINYIQSFNPLFFLRNGELLLAVDGRELKTFNPAEMTFHKVVYRKNDQWFAAASYVESLVSPNGGGVDGEESSSRR